MPEKNLEVTENVPVAEEPSADAHTQYQDIAILEEQVATAIGTFGTPK